MKKNNNNGVESTCASTTAVNNVKDNVKKDVHMGWVPFEVKECKLMGGKHFVMPCYKVRFWGEEDSDNEYFWLGGGRLYDEKRNHADVLRDTASFVYGSALVLMQLFKIYHTEEELKAIEEQSNGEDVIEKANQEMEFYLWRYNELETIEFEEPIYVGLDIWDTPEGQKYSVSGSTWLLDLSSKKGKHGILIDGFMIEELNFIGLGNSLSKINNQNSDSHETV
jgi:hypothetical protein